MENEERACIDCNNLIPQARLEVVPISIRCVSCGSKFDVKKNATLKVDPDAPHPRGW